MTQITLKVKPTTRTRPKNKKERKGGLHYVNYKETNGGV